MMGTFLTRALILALGYAYPAYECYKTVELNKPQIEQLRFWCQYWILVAVLTAFERVGDAFVSWLPMYCEAKLAFYVFLWYPRTKGTTYVYESFFRPYIAKHETDIDRNLLELRTKAGDILALHWQKAASYGQTRFFQILEYVAAQSPSQQAQPHPTQHSQPQQNHQAPLSATARRPTVPQQIQQQQQQQQLQVPSSPSKSQQKQQQQVQERPTRSVDPQPTAEALIPGRTSSAPAQLNVWKARASTASADGDVKQDAQERTIMEEAIRITRAGLKRRAAAGNITSNGKQHHIPP